MEPIIQSLWIGKSLSKLEQLSMKSFIDHGHIYHLYTYDNVENIPNGVIVKDGNDILSKDEIYTYKNGSVSAFSNLFRFTLLYKKGGYWVDTDLICLKKFTFKEDDIVLSTEPLKSYNSQTPISSLIKLNKNSKEAKFGMDTQKEHKKQILNRKLGWGSGPLTVKLLVEKFDLRHKLLNWNRTCSCCWLDYKSIFYPNTPTNINVIKKMEDIPKDMLCIHLWHEMLRQGGIDKNKKYDDDSIFERLKKKHNIN